MATENSDSFHYPTLITLLAIGVMASFSGGLINPTIPAIQSTYASVPNSETLAQLVSTMSAPVVVIVAPIVGILLDKYRRKPIAIAAILIYGFGTSIAFFLDSIYLILATRIFDGIAVAAAMVVVPTLITDYYEGSKRESVMGYYGAVQAGAGAVAVILGGMIADVNWRYIFLVFAFALLLVPLVVRYLPEPEVTEKTSNAAGRIEAVKKIIRDSPVVLLFGIYVLVMFTMLTNNLIHIEVPYYLQGPLELSGSITGVALASAMIAAVVAAAMYGRIKARLRHISIVVIAFTAASVGYMIIGAAQQFTVVLLGIIVGAGGLGLILPTANDWVASIVAKEYRGRALSGVTMAMYLGFAVSPFAPVPLINEFGRPNTFLLWGGFLVLVAAFAAFLRWTSGRKTTAKPTPTVEHND